MKRADVWRVRLPSIPGHTQAGERPAVILQDGPFNLSLPTTLIIPFTSTLSAARFAGTLLVQPDGQNGLTTPSIALVFQLSAIDKRNCLRQLGILDGKTFDDLLAVVDRLLGR